MPDTIILHMQSMTIAKMINTVYLKRIMAEIFSGVVLYNYF